MVRARLLRGTVPFGFCLLLILLAGPAAACAAGQAPNSPEARAIDDLLMKAFKPDQPGGAALVTRKGQILLRKGYGMADMELKVPVEPDMVFRLGSVTKQFTAVSILMLEERGKLSVRDPITKFLPDYPTHGHTITIEHLLTHTSGIRSMTSLPEWPSLWRKDFSVVELINFFKDQPMDFAPDERWLYNNSGYLLLGAIIEKASGQSYDAFLQKNIFEPVGMSHSYYDRTELIIPRRVKGYARSGQGFQNAPYLSMTQPYAAGALASTVDDLALWNAALWSGKLVKQETLARAQTPYKLKNGQSTGYGYGWMIGAYEGRRTVEHGGGIHGFATYELSIPDEDIFAVILTNGSAGPGVSPEGLDLQMAAIALGKPVVDPKPITLSAAQMDRLVGVYAIDEKQERVISREGNQLYSQRSGGNRSAIQPLSEFEFFIPQSRTRLVFIPDAAGKIARVELRPRLGMVESATRTERAVSARKEIDLDPGILRRYVGVYELAPNFNLSVTLEEGKLMSQATGQAKVQIFPESDSRFFLKVVDAQIEFMKDESGNVTGLKLYQGGRTTAAKKLKE